MPPSSGQSPDYPPAGSSTAAPHSSPSPAGPNKKSRNLIVGIDGTANKFGRKNTNVVKLLEAIDTVNVEQHKIYLGGIGTGPRVTHVFKRIYSAITDKVDMAIAWNVAKIVKDAYGWLAGEYREGDRIYLFGFSRGAYQVRILAWMIHEVGLIKKPTETQIGSAYDHFESIMLHQPGASYMAREFKKMFSREDSQVHFIGVWDTVSSVGFGRGDACLSASSAAEHARHIRHALALDERRVKYLPEYFLEMNSLNSRSSAGDNVREDRSNLENADQPTLPSSDRKVIDIKEVWFAGSHSDVGGKHYLGTPFHAGRVSLIWMRREAAASGLEFNPEDIFCSEEDLDLGTTCSMSPSWKLMEILPLQHQVSFSGSGENDFKWHLCKPRRIIPEQKIHASVKLTHSYIPKATFGKEFGSPFSTDVPMSSLKNIWEWDAIKQRTYNTLFDKLEEAGTEPFYLHRLLFVLRLSRGQSSITSDQWKILYGLITSQSGLVRLAATAVSAEVMNPSDSEVPLPEGASQEICTFLRKLRWSEKDCQIVASFLPPIAKHKQLRDLIFTDETDGVIDSFLNLLESDEKAKRPYLSVVLRALSSLAQHCPDKIINKVNKPLDGNTSRVLLMLGSNDPSHLTDALLVVNCLIQKALFLCSQAKTRLHELARKHQGRVRRLAAMALTLLYLYQESHAQSRGTDKNWMSTEGYVLHRMLPAGPHRSNIKSLNKAFLNAIDGRDMRARITVIFILLQMREAGIKLTTLPLGKDIMDVFVEQLQLRDSALLAAYALIKCLTDEEFNELVKSKSCIGGYIVNMIRLDYFDEAIGPTEGITILEDLMEHDELKTEVLNHDFSSVLKRKLGAGTPRGMRTGLMYLKILQDHDERERSLTDDLVDRGMDSLKTDKWKTQKAGVAILCSLAQVAFGVEALEGKICDIIGLLLPTDIEETGDLPSSRSYKPAASLLGPAFVIHVLAGNEKLRDVIRETKQYGHLKRDYLFGDLISAKEVSFWHINTPTREDVLEAICQMIKTMDFGMKGYTDTRFTLPRINHWDRVRRLAENRLLKPAGIAGAAVLTGAGVLVMTPVVACSKLADSVEYLWQRCRQDAIIRELQISSSSPDQ